MPVSQIELKRYRDKFNNERVAKMVNEHTASVIRKKIRRLSRELVQLGCQYRTQCVKRPLLSVDDEQRLLSQVGGDQLITDAAVVIVDTGLRQGELLELRKGDINNNLLRIHSRQVVRNVPLTERALKILKRRGENIKGNELLFNITTPRLSLGWARLRGAVGLDNLVLYDLRRTFIQRLLDSKVCIPEICALTGVHTSTLVGCFKI